MITIDEFIHYAQSTTFEVNPAKMLIDSFALRGMRSVYLGLLQRRDVYQTEDLEDVAEDDVVPFVFDNAYMLSNGTSAFHFGNHSDFIDGALKSSIAMVYCNDSEPVPTVNGYGFLTDSIFVYLNKIPHSQFENTVLACGVLDLNKIRHFEKPKAYSALTRDLAYHLDLNLNELQKLYGAFSEEDLQSALQSFHMTVSMGCVLYEVLAHKDFSAF